MNKMKVNKEFKPLTPKLRDETLGGYPFAWNITVAEQWIAENRNQVELATVKVLPTGQGSDSEALDQHHIPKADLSKPVIIVRMRPEFFRLIDGNHRVARARREGVTELPAYYLTEEQHRQFFIYEEADRLYADYWNEKLEMVEKYGGKWAVVGEMEV